MSYTVTLEPFDIEFPCSEDETVLEAAFRAGLSLRYGCKHGGCGGCKHQLANGEVDYNDHATAISEDEMDRGIALLCCAYPEEDLVITLDDDYQEDELTPEFPLRVYETQVAALNQVTHDTVHLVMNGGEAGNYRFHPGQYLEIRVPGTEEWRSFSMANVPNNMGQTELVIKLIPGGAFSGYLKDRSKPGDTVEFRGPYGQFQLSETSAEIIMIAGGSGMAPIMSMLQQLVDEKSEREVSFFYGARAVRDLYFVDEINTLGSQLKNFRFIPALSEPTTEDNWEGETGLITEVLSRHAGSLRGAEGYLCGPPPMIDAAVEVLKQKGMFNSRIKFDKFVQNT
jgi:NAD(P)H-flavin reductase/ferredoxin